MTTCNPHKKMMVPFGSRLALLILCICAAIISSAMVQRAGFASSIIAPDADLNRSVEESLKTVRLNIEQLEEQLERAERLEVVVSREVNAYETLVSVHSGLILSPGTEREALEKARVENRTMAAEISTRLKDLKRKTDEADGLLQQSEEKSVINKRRLSDLEGQPQKDAVSKTALQGFYALSHALSTEREILQKLRDTYVRRTEKLEQIQQDVDALSGNLDQEITRRKKELLFEKTTFRLSGLTWKGILDEVDRLSTQAGSLTAKEQWSKQARVIWESSGFSLVTVLLLVGLVHILLLRLRRHCLLFGQRPFWSQHRWPSVTLEVFQRSLLLFGITLLLYIYANIRQLYATVPAIRIGIQVLVIWLVCRWLLDFVHVRSQQDDAAISSSLALPLRRLVRAVGIFAVLYLVLQGILGSASVILFLGRVLFEIAFLAWSISFWKKFRQQTGQPQSAGFRFLMSRKHFMVAVGYIIALGGLFLEFSGYGQLALFWYVSWGRTAIVLFWASLFFFLLRAWHTSRPIVTESEDSLEETAKRARWLVVRLSWLVWIVALAICLLLAWGAREAVLLGFVGVLNRPIQVGSIRFRLIGFVYAFLILLFTHAAARIWRQILKKRILADSGLEVGLQDSVTTVMVYLVWVVGILISLTAVGFSTTSLTVVFGALGVGLGFGLQNIFNNFVSGLILLFERPVQVGDVVEVNGVWGVITKINVRATQVQTYDNASFIIPNSEFISKQVTNWSFKDLRLRRSIVVGVAYGSPTELVRETLLEIAAKHPKVLKRPKPDVLFEDFADSALIFKLRAWTTVEHFIAVETDIRFEIDRLFRERNISIAFPQRDIHIRTVAENAKINIEGKRDVAGDLNDGVKSE
ncbi:MAG: mechanosensitive ion channel [Deltaproteobacteria bacterium]